MSLNRIARIAALLVCAGAILHAQTAGISSVVNAASQSAALAPGTLADVSGAGLGTTGTVTADVGGIRTTVISSSDTKWRILIPFSAPVGSTTVNIGPWSSPITLARYAPALFSADQTGSGIVAAQGYRPTTSDKTGYVLGTANPAKLGDVLYLNATGLGPYDPDNENVTVDPNGNLNTATVTIDGRTFPANASYIATTASGCRGSFCKQWMYQIVIGLPSGMLVGNQPVSIKIGGLSSQTLTVPINSTPLVNAVVNAASNSLTAPIAPGSLVTVYGTTFGVANQATGFPATDFKGVSVSFNGVKAPLLYLGTAEQNELFAQINLQAPVELPEAGPATVKVTTPDGVSADFTIQTAAAAPGVFVIPSFQNPTLRSAATVVANTNWLVIPGALATEYGIPGGCRAGLKATDFCGEPAKPGDAVRIYVTGLGKAAANGEPSQGILGTGQFAPASGSPLYKALQQPTVTVGGVPAVVSFAGVDPGWYEGFYRIDITIPATAPTGDYLPLVVTTPNGQKDDKATIAVRP